MDRRDPQSMEQWADSVLDAHRSAPAGSASIEDQPFAEALARASQRRETFAVAQAVVWLIGIVLAAGFLYSFLSNF